MHRFDRRNFLKASAVGVGSLAAAQAEKATTPPMPVSPSWPRRYGTANGRTSFRAMWKDHSDYPFHHEDHPTFHRLRTTLDAYYSRAEQPLKPLHEGPVRLVVKLLVEAEAGRTLFTLGLKSKSHGNWAFNIGACPTWGISFGDTGWQIMVNSANPWKERVSLAGFDNRDWHTFELIIPDAKGPAQLYCDSQFVMKLVESITDARREQERATQIRHGSVRQPVPETAGDGEYLFIESRHPGQFIDVDRIEVTQRPLSTRRRTLAVLLDRDWDLEGTHLVENTVTRYEGNPILNKTDIPDPTAENNGGNGPKIIRDGNEFHMYFNAVLERNRAPGRLDVGRLEWAPYHAFSTDGIHWEVTPKHPVLTPGDEEAWDAAGLGAAGVVKDRGLFRMWYGGYVRRLQQGRTGYAESRDGIHWVKPTLGLLPFAGKASNLCFSLQPGLNSNEYELPVHVVKDEDGPPERRFVMFLHTQGPQGFIVDVAVSPDGRRFTRARHNARHYAFEEAPRKSTLHGGAKVLHEADYWWAFVEQDSKQNTTQMKFTGWAVEPGERENISFGLWRSKRTHLDPEAGARDQNCGTVSSVLEMGDEWWVYYSYDGNIELAKVGRHRIFGIEIQPGSESGQVTTLALEPPPAGWGGHHLILNASGLVEGSKIEAELLDGLSQNVIEGYALADSLAVAKDGLDILLQWHGKGTALPQMRSPLRIRFKLTRGGRSPQVHAVYVRAHRP